MDIAPNDPAIVEKVYRAFLDDFYAFLETKTPGSTLDIKLGGLYRYDRNASFFVGKIGIRDGSWGFEPPAADAQWPTRAARLQEAWAGTTITTNYTLYCTEDRKRCAEWFDTVPLPRGSKAKKSFDAVSTLRVELRITLPEKCQARSAYMPLPEPGPGGVDPAAEGNAVVAVLFDRCRNAQRVWLIKSSGDGEFDQGIMYAFAKWRASPRTLQRSGTLDANSAGTVVLIPVQTVP